MIIFLANLMQLLEYWASLREEKKISSYILEWVSPKGITMFFEISRKIPLMGSFSKKLQVYNRNPPWVLPCETASFDVFLTPILSII